MKRSFYVALLVVLCSSIVFAANSASFNDPCYTADYLDVVINFGNYTQVSELTGNLFVANDCVGGNEVLWPLLNLTVLGNITDGEVVVGEDFIFVDTAARPDLDVPAKLTFNQVKFAVEPDVLRNGVLCGDCNKTFDPVTRKLVVDVPGFSNYSLTGLQQFSVRSDYQPELKAKTYSVVDLGDSYRDTEFACIVQIYALNGNNEYILVQTNPQRQVQARLLGNPDTNQPESLGYFPTKNGVANVYFRGDQLFGYIDYKQVIQCVSNVTSLTYEEDVAGRYAPLGRNAVARGVWVTRDENAFYLSAYVFGGLIVVFVLLMVWQRIKWRL